MCFMVIRYPPIEIGGFKMIDVFKDKAFMSKILRGLLKLIFYFYHKQLIINIL
jgi:hypothetical protein